MLNIMGRLTMMNMAGGMPDNIKQPMANFGYGNNINFYGTNVGNNMGYAQENGTGSTF